MQGSLGFYACVGRGWGLLLGETTDCIFFSSSAEGVGCWQGWRGSVEIRGGGRSGYDVFAHVVPGVEKSRLGLDGFGESRFVNILMDE